MVATVSINPIVTTNGFGAFTTQNDGDVQGTFMDDPAVRFALRGGILATTETLPMWGGVAVSELVPTPSVTTADASLGTILGRATTFAVGNVTGALTGFSVFNQAHNMILTPQSPVPLAGSGQSVHYFRIGSGARIAVACDPSLVSLDGGLTSQNVGWDFNSQRLVNYVTTTSGTGVTISSATWTSTAGGVMTITTSVAVTAVAGVGDALNISGATNTGTGGATVVNGNFIVSSFNSATNFSVFLPAASGVVSTIGGTAGTWLVNEPSGSLTSQSSTQGAGLQFPARVDRVSAGNSMIVAYNTATGFATWTFNGSTAIITI